MAERAPGAVAPRMTISRGAEGRAPSVAPSFTSSPFRSEGGRISTTISSPNVGERGRFSTPFIPRALGAEPVSPKVTSESLSGLLKQKPYEGMYSRPVSLVKEPKIDASEKQDSVKSFMKKLPGEIVPKIPEVQSQPKPNVRYPIWTRPGLSEQSKRVAEIKNELNAMPQKVSLEKKPATESVATQGVDRKPSVVVSHAVSHERKISTSRIETVRAEIDNISTLQSTENAVTFSPKSLSTNETTSVPAAQEKPKSLPARDIKPTEALGYKTLLQKRVVQKVAAHTSALLGNSQVAENQSTSNVGSTQESHATQNVNEKKPTIKDKIKAKILSGFSRKKSGGEEGKYIVDTEAQKARKSAAEQAISAADHGDGLVDGAEIVAHMGAEPSNAMVSGLLKMIGLGNKHKEVDGSYAKLVHMIGSIGRVKKIQARLMVHQGVESYRAVAYSEEEATNTVTDNEVQTVIKGGEEKEYALAA